jgi:raffinose/stachyose/melibiose transport system permease protein
MSRPTHGPRAALTPNYMVIVVLSLVALGPILILIFNALKTNADLGRDALGPPAHPTWSNFPDAWKQGLFSVSVPNSVILVVGTVIAAVFLGGMAAYSIGRLRPPGTKTLTMYLLVASSLPIQLFLVPLFYLWHAVGLTNSLFGLIIIYVATNSPFSIFLMRSYMIRIPNDFEDAGRIDGAGELKIFLTIIVPIVWPAFLTAGLVVGLNVWNEYLLALVFLTNPNHYTVVISYYNFQTEFTTDWSLTSAAAVMMIAPILVLFLALQRRFVEGLTQGGVKA